MYTLEMRKIRDKPRVRHKRRHMPNKIPIFFSKSKSMFGIRKWVKQIDDDDDDDG